MVKKCARCGGDFDDAGYEVFVTCESCRIPLPSSVTVGGCQRWSGHITNKRVTQHRDPFEVAINETCR